MKNIVAISLFAFAACGGQTTPVAQPEPEPQEEPESEPEEIQIPTEKFDSVRHTFGRKAKSVARCFPEAVAAGELEDTARVQLTVSLLIEMNGSSSEREIASTSTPSATLEQCVLDVVGRWKFTKLPKPLRYSYGFTLQQF